MVILMILILPIQEHGASFLSIVSSSVSFISVLQFSKYCSFTALNLFLSILFDATVNVSFISLIITFVSFNFTEFIDELFLDFLCMESCHLQTVTVLLLPLQSGFISFSSSDCCGWNFQYYGG